MIRLLGIAVTCFCLGSGIGFDIGTAAAPRPPQPPVGVVRYADGLKRLDGETIWGGMSPYLHDQTVKSGDTHASFVDFYTQLRANPASHIDQIQYIGGYQAKDKGYFIYVSRHFVPGKDPTEVVWLFVTDENGLVDLAW